MIPRPHPQQCLQHLAIGTEQAPLLIVDNLVAEPELLVQKAAGSNFSPQGAFFPGLRARAPLSYRQFLADFLKPLLPALRMQPGVLTFPMAHYSLVSQPVAQLVFQQRIPHVDSVAGNGLATVHYLFRGDWGGTAFYRHRQSGFEVVDATRREAYFRTLDDQRRSHDFPDTGYISGDTKLFEQVVRVDGVFNRMLVYRRNSLHSGCIDNQRVPPPDPLKGRLSINCFIDVG